MLNSCRAYRSLHCGEEEVHCKRQCDHRDCSCDHAGVILYRETVDKQSPQPSETDECDDRRCGENLHHAGPQAADDRRGRQGKLDASENLGFAVASSAGGEHDVALDGVKTGDDAGNERCGREEQSWMDWLVR